MCGAHCVKLSAQKDLELEPCRPRVEKLCTFGENPVDEATKNFFSAEDPEQIVVSAIVHAPFVVRFA